MSFFERLCPARFPPASRLEQHGGGKGHVTRGIAKPCPVGAVMGRVWWARASRREWGPDREGAALSCAGWGAATEPSWWGQRSGRDFWGSPLWRGGQRGGRDPGGLSPSRRSHSGPGPGRGPGSARGEGAGWSCSRTLLGGGLGAGG